MSFVDPITLEQIPEDKLVEFQQLGQKFQFDVRTLAKIENNINPMNRQPLPAEVISQIDIYRRSIELQVQVIFKNRMNFKISKMNDIGSLILEMYKLWNVNLIGGHQIELSWISCNERFRRNPFLLDLDIELQQIIDSDSCTLTLVATRQDRGTRLNILYKYAYRHEIPWLQELIPQKYQEDPPNLILPDQIDYRILRDFAAQNSNKNEQYVLRGMRKLANKALLSAEMANEIVGLLKDPILQGAVQEILYPRVIDRYNLPSNNSYYTDPYDIPEEFIEKTTPTYMNQLINLLFSI